MYLCKYYLTVFCCMFVKKINVYCMCLLIVRELNCHILYPSLLMCKVMLRVFHKVYTCHNRITMGVVLLVTEPRCH